MPSIYPCSANNCKPTNQPTKHLGDVVLDVQVLQVLVGLRVEQADRGVEPNGQPDSGADLHQLADLTIATGVHRERALQI